MSFYLHSTILFLYIVLRCFIYKYNSNFLLCCFLMETYSFVCLFFLFFFISFCNHSSRLQSSFLLLPLSPCFSLFLSFLFYYFSKLSFCILYEFGAFFFFFLTFCFSLLICLSYLSPSQIIQIFPFFSYFCTTSFFLSFVLSHY